MKDRKTQRVDPEDDQETVPVARKKKKKKKKKPSRWPLYAGLGAGGLVVIALCILVIGKVMSGPPPAQPVTEWEKYSTEDNEFGFEYPAVWKVKEYGIKDRHEVYLTQGAASITFKENLAGSLVGDIAGASTRGREIPDDQLPVARVHEARKPKDARSYQEEPAVTVITKRGKARRSAYKDGNKRGYRATVLLQQTALDIFCECRASDWDTLRPAFDRVIETVGRGGT
jgi:hypothetical protein